MGVNPDSKVHGANMGPNWGRQGLGEPHVGLMNLAFWEDICSVTYSQYGWLNHKGCRSIHQNSAKLLVNIGFIWINPIHFIRIKFTNFVCPVTRKLREQINTQKLG